MKQIAQIILIITSALFMMRCAPIDSGAKSITVTIPPLKGIVNQIVGDDYEVNVLLPAGTSPETYSPTISQLTAVNNADYLFIIGTLNFEESLVNSLTHNVDCKITNTSHGIYLIEGECNHTHHHSEEEYSERGEHHAHRQGVDPHVWMSHRGLLKIIDNITSALISNNPDSARYTTNAERLKGKVMAQMSAAELALASAPKSFLIYHPALSYFAEEYGLEQISLENEGKNPTPKSLAGIIEKVNNEGLRTLLYQQEYPKDVVKPIADVLDVNLFQINPLSEDIVAELNGVINILSSGDE